MTIGIIAFLALGIIFGRLFPEIARQIDTGTAITFCLLFMLVIVGINLSFSKNNMAEIKTKAKDVFIIVLGSTVGSLIASCITGTLLGLNTAQAGAIGIGLGWASFIGVALSSVSVYLGTVAFLTNSMRELMAIVGMKIYMKKFGKRAAISAAGSTAIDTSLGVITRYAGKEYAVTSILCGTILSFVTPFMLSILTPLF